MPRKVNYSLDRDEDYDIYEDYDYAYDEEYGPDLDQNGKTHEPKQETIKPGVWRCPICTFDNDESMSACEICGVLRNPLVKPSTNKNTSTVGGKCKDSGASRMAKSLFASLPYQTPKKAVIVDNNFHKLGNIQGHFHDLHKPLSSLMLHLRMI